MLHQCWQAPNQIQTRQRMIAVSPLCASCRNAMPDPSSIRAGVRMERHGTQNQMSNVSDRERSSNLRPVCACVSLDVESSWLLQCTLRFCSTQGCTLLVLWQYFQIS